MNSVYCGSNPTQFDQSIIYVILHVLEIAKEEGEEIQKLVGELLYTYNQALNTWELVPHCSEEMMKDQMGNSASVHEKSSDLLELPGFSTYDQKALLKESVRIDLLSMDIDEFAAIGDAIFRENSQTEELEA